MAEKKNPGERGTGRGLNISDPKVFEAVKKRAYDLYCKRGCTNGNDMKDWLEAENQVRREIESRS